MPKTGIVRVCLLFWFLRFFEWRIANPHGRGSQSELAKQIQVSREIVGRYERGDAVPSIDIAKRMADAFEVSLDYLVGASEKQLNKEMVKRIEDVDKMRPDDKKMIYAFLDAFITKTKLQTLL